MTTVGRLARKHGLSRSALLYYDRIGLLKPSFGGNGAYRRYSPEDEARLVQILAFREAGLPLDDIRRVLDQPGSGLAAVLEKRLFELNSAIARLRDQQRVIVGLLQNRGLYKSLAPMTRDRWVGLLTASGFTEKDMEQWHIDFEQTAPRQHQEFLSHLGFTPEETAVIREHARKTGKNKD